MRGVDPATDPLAGGPADPLSWVFEQQDRDIPALVREALALGRVQLAFQPVVTAGSEGRIAFHEGFVRLLDPAGRVLPANRFLGAVEDGELGRDLDTAALRIGLATLRHHPGLRLAINMSARSIGDAGWRRVLEEGLGRGSDPGGRLILEISESSAMLLPEVVMRFMAELQPRGVAFALDDFGAGMISFRHLRDFLFDLVKIDPVFVRGIDANPDNQVLAEALITVARQFQMFAVAEGVETPEEAAMMTRLGADCLQGYLFGRPRPTL
jgi:EAL domain-containing protein (putative c-di-GMP-specific phosphodiesterase class I)